MAQRYLFHLSLAGITLAIDTDRPLSVEPEFAPFLVDGPAADYTAVFRQVSQLPPIPETVLHEDHCYRVHPDGRGGYLRSFFDAPRDLTAYALAVYDYENHTIRADYLEKGAHCVAHMHNSFFHLGLETLLLQENRLCLHASCVNTHLGGILFSGKSGIGKSTQAELWCRHRGAGLVNGDRPVLSQENGRWLAWGSPYAGSSKCHVRENCPVSAIVMLRQDAQCSLRRLSPPEAFRAIWSGLTMNSWNEKMVQRAVELAMELIDAVPVWELSCTPDIRAVDFLEGELRNYGTTEHSRYTPQQSADGPAVPQSQPDAAAAERRI